MSIDLSVSSVSPVPQPADPPPARTTPRDAAPATAGRPFPNPTLRLDPELGMVVIEFRDGQGAVKASIPTEQQLDAYRAAERTHSGTTKATDQSTG